MTCLWEFGVSLLVSFHRPSLVNTLRLGPASCLVVERMLKQLPHFHSKHVRAVGGKLRQYDLTAVMNQVTDTDNYCSNQMQSGIHFLITYTLNGLMSRHVRKSSVSIELHPLNRVVHNHICNKTGGSLVGVLKPRLHPAVGIQSNLPAFAKFFGGVEHCTKNPRALCEGRLKRGSNSATMPRLSRCVGNWIF